MGSSISYEVLAKNGSLTIVKLHGSWLVIVSYPLEDDDTYAFTSVEHMTAFIGAWAIGT